MVGHLLESAGHSRRSGRGLVVSVIIHAALIGIAVHLSANAGAAIVNPSTPSMIPVWPQRQSENSPQQTSAARAGGRHSTSLSSINIPTVNIPSSVAPPDIPPIDNGRLSEQMLGVGDPSKAGGGIHGATYGTSGTTGPGGEHAGPWTVMEVEESARPLSNVPRPPYPEPLRAAGIEGQVRARFVIDSTGKVESGSLQILQADHDLFAAAVRATLPKIHFQPARVGGHAVRELVEQTFLFSMH